MKRILAAILALVLMLSFAACSDNTDNTEKTDSKKQTSSSDVKNDKASSSDAKADSLVENADGEAINIEKEPSKENGEKGESKPQDNPQSKPVQQPQQQPQQQPEQQPEAPTPEDNTPKTVGNILLADFKAKAASSDALSLAEALVANPVMADIMAGAMEVEPGLLTGFDNNEITGFKSGAVFMPMIGTIPFVGYVFELENGVDTSSFISNLKSSANLRWNICTKADEMVSGSVGNKVFFVMCPTSFEQE